MLGISQQMRLYRNEQQLESQSARHKYPQQHQHQHQYQQHTNAHNVQAQPLQGVRNTLQRHVPNARHIVDRTEPLAPSQRREPSPNYTINPITGNRTSPRRRTAIQSQTHARSASATERLPSITPLLHEVAPPPIQQPNPELLHEAHDAVNHQHDDDDGFEVVNTPTGRIGRGGQDVVSQQRPGQMVEAVNIRAEEEEEGEREQEEEISSDGEFPDGKGLLQAVEVETGAVAGTSGLHAGRGRGRGGRGGRGGHGRGRGGRGGAAAGRKASLKGDGTGRDNTKAVGKVAEPKTKRGGKGSRSGTNRREAGASDEEIGELDKKEVQSVIEASEATHWELEETISMVRYICEKERFKTFKATRAHVIQEVRTSRCPTLLLSFYHWSTIPNPSLTIFLCWFIIVIPRLFSTSFPVRLLSRLRTTGIVNGGCTRHVVGMRRMSLLVATTLMRRAMQMRVR